MEKPEFSPSKCPAWGCTGRRPPSTPGKELWSLMCGLGGWELPQEQSPQQTLPAFMSYGTCFIYTQHRE